MASILNSRYGDQTGLFTGEWENVEAYSSLVVTMSYTGNLTMIFNLRWGELRNGNVTQLFDETISLSGPNSVTLERAIKSRWFQLYQSGRTTDVINIATSYKRAPTQIMISDPSSNIVNISSGLNTVTTDTSGRVYGNTNSSTGTSLFTTLADPSGNSLATTSRDRGIVRDNEVTLVEFSVGSESGYGSLVLSTNCFRLPKSQITFRDGDRIVFTMGNKIDAYIAGPDEGDNNLTIDGILSCNGKVRFMVIEENHIQFQILVNKDMREWFDPAVGFNNFGTVPILATEPMVEGVDSFYLRLVNVDGSIPTVEDYYAALHAAFNVPVTILDVGTYPVDTRFYRGSLSHIPGNSNRYSVGINMETPTGPESLIVAVGDSQADDITSTYTGQTLPPTAYYGDRSLSSILYAFDVCFTEDVSGIATTMDSIAPLIYTQLVVYGDVTQSGNIVFDGTNLYQLTGSPYISSNFWKLLMDYSNLESADSCLSLIFRPSLGAIVLFHSGDTSASFQERMAFDICSNYFNGIDKIVVTDTTVATPELLAFTGDIDSIYSVNSFADLSNNVDGIKDILTSRIHGVKYQQKNAMYVRPTDVRGMYQGAVEVSGAAFSGAAMLYTLADDRGYKISSLDTSSDGSLNGLYVALASNYATDGTTGNSFGAINANRMLHLAITEQSSVTTKMFDMVLDSDVSLVTTTDLSNAEVKLMHLGITNNTAATAWVKVYDMSRGFYSADPYDNSGIPPLAKLAYNIAVPAQEYRDIDCNIGIGFNDGIYFGVSDSHVYEGYNFGVGDGVFIHGTYQIV